MTQDTKPTVDKNLAKLVDIVLATGSRKAMEDYYQTLTMVERVDLMAYMQSITNQQLFLKVRNLAENLAK